MRKLAVLALVVLQMTVTLFQVKAEKQRPFLTVLSSSEQVFNEVPFIKDVAVHSSNDDHFFYILSTSGQINVYNSQHKLLRRVSSHMLSPDSIAVDPEGRIYIADSKMSQVKVLSSKGESTKTISVNRPFSIAALSNGNIVIASTSNSSLLHIYDSSGRKLRSFGRIKRFIQDNESQNRFLNRGKVLVDSSDTIYYVYKYSPTPIVQRFSRKGKPLSEFIVTGDSIDLQLEVSQEFLRNRHGDKVGGISIINSASIDPATDHLWLSMNGASDSGVVYEYGPDGMKLQEYSFIINPRTQSSKVITGVNHVIVRAPSIDIFTLQDAFHFNLNQSAPITQIQPQAATCPATVEFGDCKTPCGTTTSSDDKDCKAELLASVNLTGRRIIETVCNTDSSSCTAQIKVCKESDGVQTTHNITLTCGSSGGGGEGGNDRIETIPLPPSPIVIDTQGNGFDLTNAANGVDFDIDGDGTAERLGWTVNGSDDSWLALDRNGNGSIDDGTELFGNFTLQPSSANQNGFIALAEYDKPINGGNNNSKIESGDAIFSSLRLWQDTNHNGISETSELNTLPSLGVSVIDLDYKEKKRRDENGNWFRYRAKVYDSRGAQVGRWAWDVFLGLLP